MKKYRQQVVGTDDFHTAMELAQSAVVWLEQRCEDIDCPSLLVLLMLEMYIPTYIDIHARLPRDILRKIAKESGRSEKEVSEQQMIIVSELRKFVTEAGANASEELAKVVRERTGP